MERPSWSNYFKEMVTVVSKRSSCNRLKVGCILVKDNRMISAGYNGFLPGFSHTSCVKNGHEINTIHAEQNAILDCAKRGVECKNCDVYVTHYPCYNCLKFLLAIEVNNIYYINDYNNDEMCNELLKESNTKIHKI